MLTANIISLGLTTITIALWSSGVTDPVNVTKLFLLGGFALAAMGSALSLNLLNTLRAYKLFAVSIFLFLLNSVLVLLISPAPFVQSVYGVYGRNNGFLLYMLLGLITLATLTIKENLNFSRFIVAIGIAGSINLAYAIWVVIFGDFIGWNNPYGNLLGTLGNPNFIGSFFGMISGPLFVFLLRAQSSLKVKLVALFCILLVAFGIQQTSAVQGRVLFVANFLMIVFFFLRAKFSNVLPQIVYLCVSGALGVIAILGTLQVGPLTKFVYKTSVSLRGEYWYAAWKTGIDNPWFGVGFDSFGDWYRRSRRDSALVLPGVETVTNAGHNVFLDILAFGGFPLLATYVMMVVAVLVSILKFIKSGPRFDPIFLSLLTVWLSYQAQSIISINQVGLAIWGWVFGAAIVAYQRNHIAEKASTQSESTQNRKLRNSESVISPNLRAGLAFVTGLLIAVPPLSSDIGWSRAMLSQDASLYEKELRGGYLHPLNSIKMDTMVGTFQQNGLDDLAYRYAKQAVEFNPDSFNAWQNFLKSPKLSNKERQIAVDNLVRLDPLNPNVKKLS